MSETKLYGFGVRGYRGVGGELQRVGPLNKINLLIGPNNAGKSNILRFLWERMSLLERPVGSSINQKQVLLEGFAQHRGGSGNVPHSYAVAYPRAWLERPGAFREGTHPIVAKELGKLLDYLTDDWGLVWIEYHVGEGQPRVEFEPQFLLRIAGLAVDFGRLENHLADGTRTGTQHERVRHVMHRLVALVEQPTRKVTLVPAFRRSTSEGSTEGIFSGAGLIHDLARLQNPSAAEHWRRERFDRINDFLREVTKEATAEISVPYERDTINVSIGDKLLPLEALGSGIEEMIILAAAATIADQSIVCIEEPEMHLHPLLQRQLLRYLDERTTNQYFIATHSASILDTPGASVFSVRQENGETVVSHAHSAHERFGICADLGYRASDLLQSNCIIWVEGPSDRIYLRHWMEREDANLVEGLHFSIMFYGGRLLSHLSADDPEVDEFISLRRLNRNLIILMDSDRSQKGEHLNATKRRIRDDFNRGPGFAWVTEGREVENYIDTDVLEQAVQEVHPKIKRLPAKHRYANLLKILPEANGKRKRSADKVKVASHVVAKLPSMDVLDLREQVKKVVRTVQSFND